MIYEESGARQERRSQADAQARAQADALQWQIALTTTPSQCLNGDAYLLLKANRVHDMPAIHAKTLL